MRKLIFTGLTFIFALVVFQSCNEHISEETVSDDLSLKSANSGAKSYIVVLNDSELNDELSKLKGYEKKQEAVQSASEKILKRALITGGLVEHVYGTALHGFSVMIPPGQLKKLQDDPSVESVEEDKVITLIEPKGKPGGGVTSQGEEVPWGIARVGGGTANYSGSGRAWIIDTGIDLDNPDLNVSKDLGVSFVRRVTSPDDDNGHGSHVSGTIAAKIDGNGVVGVAPGAMVIPVKVLDHRGSGWTSWVIAGVDYVAENASGNDAANMSLGGGVSTSLDNAVLAASSVCRFALAAGNEKDNANNHSPARVNGSNIYTVSAMGSNDNWASFSNYGNPPVDFCAPGVGIKSYNNLGGLETWNGTSMATPHVTGILLLQSSPDMYGYVSGDPDGNPDPIAHVGTISNETGTLSGIVKNNNSVPIQGATVQIASKSTTTAIDGSYSISNIPVGTYTATASATNYTENIVANVSITKNNTSTVNFTLNTIVISTYTVTGKVTDTGSNSIDNALVTIEGTNLSANTGLDGTYSISGVASGTYNFTASTNGFDSQTQNVVVNGNVTNLNFSLQLTSVGNIELSGVISGSKVKKATLTWIGATGATVQLYKNNEPAISIANSGSYNDNLGKIATGTYKYYIVDEMGTPSNTIILTVN